MAVTDGTCAQLATPMPRADHDLTVVIPAYNECQRLPGTLWKLRSYLDLWGVDYRVLVVDNGSIDGTAEIASEFGERFTTLRQPVRGKGAAVRLAMLEARGRVIAFTDADLPYELTSLQTGYHWILARRCEVVFGARDLPESSARVSRSLRRSLASVLFRALITRAVPGDVADTQCGLKLFSHDAAHELFSRATLDGFAFDAEIVLLTQCLNVPYRRISVMLINDYASSLSLTRHTVPIFADLLRLYWRRARGFYNAQQPLSFAADSEAQGERKTA